MLQRIKYLLQHSNSRIHLISDSFIYSVYQGAEAS